MCFYLAFYAEINKIFKHKNEIKELEENGIAFEKTILSLTPKEDNIKTDW